MASHSGCFYNLFFSEKMHYYIAHSFKKTNILYVISYCFAFRDNFSQSIPAMDALLWNLYQECIWNRAKMTCLVSNAFIPRLLHLSSQGGRITGASTIFMLLICHTKYFAIKKSGYRLFWIQKGFLQQSRLIVM